MSLPPQYLEPVSSDAPCGDATAVGNIWQIDNLFTPSGEDLLKWQPDWKEVRKVTERLFGGCKHVKLALVYAGIGLQKDGLPGFRDGLSLLLAWLERYWDTIYPQLDKDLSDPYEQMVSRVNELRNLTNHDIGGISMLSWLYGATICRSRSFGKLNFRGVAIVRGSLKASEGEPVPMAGDAPMTENQLEAAFSEFHQAEPDQADAQIKAVTESLQILEKLDAFISEKAGPGRGPNLSELNKALELLDKILAPFAALAAPAGQTATIAPLQALQGTPPAAAPGQPGKVNSREDVLRSIAGICDYYKRSEPSSPVPFLLQRAGKIVKMNFLEIVEDLSIENAEQVRSLLTGPKKESEENAKS